MQIHRKGRVLPIDVPAEQLGRVAGDNEIWVWYNPEGEPEVVYREPQEEQDEE